MYNLRARYYIPRIGRFLTRDTFQGISREPKSQFPYMYVAADLTNLVDRLGFAAEEPIVIALSAETLGLGAGVEVTGTLVVQNGVGFVTIDLVQGVVVVRDSASTS